jgi:hypothetical protein
MPHQDHSALKECCTYTVQVTRLQRNDANVMCCLFYYPKKRKSPKLIFDCLEKKKMGIVMKTDITIYPAGEKIMVNF